MGLIQQGQNNQVLEWGEHVFSRLLKPEDGLNREPVLSDTEKFSHLVLRELEALDTHVSWDWGNWTRMDCVLYRQDHELLRFFLHRNDTRDETSVLTWREILFGKTSGFECDSIELTPVDNHSAGATVRIKRPVMALNDSATFELDGSLVKVKLHKSLLPSNLAKSARAQMLSLHGASKFKCVEKEWTFDDDGEIEISLVGFRGSVVVTVEATNGKRQVLSGKHYDPKYKNYWYGDDIDAENAEKIRQVVEVGAVSNQRLRQMPEWISTWPVESRRRLMTIHKQAQRWGMKQADLLIKNPLGVFRASVLRQCGFSAPMPFDDLADQLKSGSFIESLRKIIPFVPDHFAEMNPDEQSCIIKRKDELASVTKVRPRPVKVSPVEILMWGAPQTGKTTALATYLCHNPQHPQWLDRRSQETTDVVLELKRNYWDKLKQNQLPKATEKTRSFKLKHTDGREVYFRDIKGGDAVDLNEEETMALKRASGLLLCIEWPDQRIEIDERAYSNARLLAHNCIYALMVTKVECHLTPEQYVHFKSNPVEVARDRKVPMSFIRLLESIPAERVFPVSVYGYLENNCPAHYLDEFGRLIPHNIDPRGIRDPFDFVMNQVLKTPNSH